ncbi:uncharacterized protein LOC135703014 [Ochlerotatus camptorhynchus]|uniref:uncharacterized protein LOC135703014 n=1 Tax=Ochlerotatus camptorhynchus TaxID=644619 RepID=UPI0031E0AA18
MSSTNTPIQNKTPFRRLGLARSIKRTGSASVTDITNTPTSALASPAECNVSSENMPSSDAHKMRPIKSTCSIGANSDTEDDNGTTPVTPANTKSTSKKTRLSLSQSWRNKITHQKQMLNIKRRKLMDEVEKCSEPEISEDNATKDTDTLPRLKESPCVNSADSSKQSIIRQRIQEVKESISVWRVGCVQALNDLQERRGSGDMESLLNMLQIPFGLVNYDQENQEFLEPD